MKELAPEELKRSYDPDLFGFETTEEVEPSNEIIGQERAVEALKLGLGIKNYRYNIYVAGGAGTGKNSTVRRFLKQISVNEPTPPDLCYVYNFDDPYQPRYLQLPPGQGCQFQDELQQLVERLQEEIPEVFESDEYQTRKKEIDEQFNQQKTEVFSKVETTADERGFMLQRTPFGINTVPVKADGKPLSQEEFRRLGDEHQAELRQRQEELQEMIQEAIREVGHIEEEQTKAVRELDRQATEVSIGPKIEELEQKYSDHPKIIQHLNAVREDILNNLDSFHDSDGEGQQNPFQMLMRQASLDRYDVNVVVDHSETEGAPVIVQDSATFGNIFGAVERRVQFGAMTTDFNMIRPGALHRANGGYLVINVDNLFRYGGLSWEALKVAIKCQLIRIEDPAHMMGYTATEGLRPEPIPMDVKIILVGSSLLYELLQFYDEDFGKLFNVKSDFDNEIDRDEEYITKFGAFIRARCEEEDDLMPFHKTGVAQVLEHSSRIAGDQRKLTGRFSDMMAIIREASYWARQAGSDSVKAEHVKKAIDERTYRHNRVEEKIQEMIERDELLVDTDGEVVGQVNGLSVYQLGDFSFGRPSRITANAYAGKGGVVNIERESELSGSLHTKGLMILKGYLAERFAQDKPLSLAGSITFEQSYGMVDGDSASSTELYALISALSGVPLQQGIAVTGSVSQKGRIQPIGGVNEKIEGFYKVCKAKGLSGKQGVLIPTGNVEHLMLDDEMIEAVRDEKFHIWAVETVEEGIELLTGQPAGALVNGEFEEGTIFYKVDQRIREINETLNKASKTEKTDEDEDEE
ncbi:MAG: Lon protease family protein [Candidatus Bipolaricaulia bacterium]